MDYLVDLNELGLSFELQSASIQVVQISYGKFLIDCPPHKHSKNYYEIHLICAGEGRLIVDNLEFEVSTGSLFTTGPLIRHEQRTNPENPMCEYCLGIEIKKHKGELAEYLSQFLATKFWMGMDNQERCLNIFRQLEREAIDRQIGYAMATQSLITQILVEMSRVYTGGAKGEEQTRTTLDKRRSLIIDQVLMNEYKDITEVELAKRVGLSTRQLQRFLKENYGKTFMALRQEARINRARDLYSKGMAISKISEEIGYSDAYYLGRLLIAQGRS